MSYFTAVSNHCESQETGQSSRRRATEPGSLLGAVPAQQEPCWEMPMHGSCTVVWWFMPPLPAPGDVVKLWWVRLDVHFMAVRYMCLQPNPMMDVFGVKKLLAPHLPRHAPELTNSPCQHHGPRVPRSLKWKPRE